MINIFIILPCSHEIQDDHVLIINKSKKKIEIMIPMKIKSLNHPSHKKYRAPSISAHHFPTWVQADWSSIFLSFWTLFLLYGCGFSESAWKRTRYWIQPDISIHILHTVLYAFSKLLTRRICLIIKSFESWWSFPWLLI